MSTLGDSATIRTIQQYLWLLWLKKRLDLNENGRISELFADRNRFLTLEPTLKNGLLIIRKRTVFTEKFCPENHNGACFRTRGHKCQKRSLAASFLQNSSF